MATYLFVLLVGLGAVALTGIVGTGASIVLLPVLAFQFGAKQAVPIMAVAGLISPSRLSFLREGRGGFRRHATTQILRFSVRSRSALGRAAAS